MRLTRFLLGLFEWSYVWVDFDWIFISRLPKVGMSWVPTARVFDFWVNETRSVHWSIKIATDGIKTDGKKKKKERKQPEQKKMGADPHNLAVYYVRTESAAFFRYCVFFYWFFFLPTWRPSIKKTAEKRETKQKRAISDGFFFVLRWPLFFFRFFFFL